MNSNKLTPQNLAGRVGEQLGTSSWIAIEQPRINMFAECTGDHQWIHVDVERAQRESPFGGTVAHGFLTLALLAPTAFEIMMANVALKQAVNYGLEKVRFLVPVHAGKRVRNHIKVLAVEDKGDGRFLVTTENTMEIEGEEKPALIAVSLAMLVG